jgi:two-component system sensor histidine kinase UhpB
MPTLLGSPDQPAEAPAASSWPWEELFITATYIGGGMLWIIASDQALAWIVDEPIASLPLQTCKGLNFVLTTGVLFYFVLRRSYSRRRRAEQQSQAVAQRFELAGRAATDVIWDWDLATNTIWWSEGFQKVFGYAKHEIEPNIESWTNRLHPDERERVVRGIHRDIDAGRAFWTDEYRFRRRDGTYAVVHDRGYIIHAAGKAVRMIGGITDITERRAAAEQLDQSRRQLRALLSRAQTLGEERARISREVHDELGQLLTALKMDLRWMEKRLSSLEAPTAGPLLDKAVEAGNLVDTTLAAVQKIATELRPSALDNLGLPAALRQEAARFEGRAGIRCQTDLPPCLEGVLPEAAIVVFRIFQEALTNVARHAGATQVEVHLTKQEDQIQLVVEDNGRGISPAALRNPRSLGLLGMQERAAALGGAVSVAAVSPHGTRVTLSLPCGSPPVSLADMI